VALYVVALWKAPELLVNQALLDDSSVTATSRLSTEHNARLIVISLGGALVVITGLLYTARNYRLAHRGQVTERYTKALERLGSDEMYVRIGGVHALEHVMRDSREYYGDVVEVLVAFIRDQAPRRANELVEERRRMRPPIGPNAPKLPSEPAADVQAALTALGRRSKRDQDERGRLAFYGVHLQGVNLVGAQLRGADLAGAQLQGADLRDAQLQGADLAGAQLWGADLEGAQLQRADLREAQLQGAHLRGAQLKRAILVEAQLRSTYLRGADLRGAQFDGANLEGANLEGADLAGATAGVDQLWSARIDVKTRFPDGSTGN
jgi:uncharacterized protein YjbI with pentapeptide repeats